LIALFDLLLVALFGYSVIPTIAGFVRGALPTDATDAPALAAVGLDALVLACSAAAFLTLFAQSRFVAICHRAVALALLIRIVFIAAEAQLPSDSGSGLFLMAADLILIPVMLIALHIAVVLHKRQ